MYDHRALPLHAISPLDPRNKPLPKWPPPQQTLSSSPAPCASTAIWQMTVTRTVLGPQGWTTPPSTGKTSPVRRRQPQQRQKKKKKTATTTAKTQLVPCEQEYGDGLYTAYPLPAMAPRRPYANNSSTTNSVCGDSISSLVLSLGLASPYDRTAAVEPLHLRGRTTAVGSDRGSAEEEEQQQPQTQQQQQQEPRPDSMILSEASSPPFLRPEQQLDGRYFWALSRNGDTVHYWLPVDLVLRGLPGSAYVPRGHWGRLVRLAEDVRLSSTAAATTAATGQAVQLIMGRCNINEPLGEPGPFICSGGEVK